ncbi:hypothetical protein [Microbispora hainanensis]|uniref:Uncharacterized protein n=1 Tax=Microbispora hainanensis TaxID=568844 RepID=A0A544YX15_9ACTN|nr:hypothetical protein [Microbispora hainanensis]TQS21297.1 hypothetical protein FLX08_12560 [Microbispora hainanensis]
MRFSKFLACAASGVAVASAASMTAAHPANAKLGPYTGDHWGVIYRNTSGDPSAVLRGGPYGRTSDAPAAKQPPPYGIGSLGLIVGGNTDHIQFGNETDFANIPLADIDTLTYWIFTGADADVFPTINRPNLNLEVDPNRPETGNYSSLVYLPNTSVAPSAPSTPLPNVWQQYDASAEGSRWYMTRPGTLTTCTQANPCSFAELKALLPDAVITYSIAINKGSNDGPFHGAVDGLRINDAVYDFEPLGVKTLFDGTLASADVSPPSESEPSEKPQPRLRPKSADAPESGTAVEADPSPSAARLTARLHAHVGAGLAARL